MLRLLVRSGQPVSIFDNFDEALQEGVHTNIIAGLALDDGETIAAWLPEAEAELETTRVWAAATTPNLAPSSISPPAIAARPPATTPSTIDDLGAFFDHPDVAIIERDGTNHQASYVGLDGLTGLSLLKLTNKNLPAQPFKTELELLPGQRLHLYSPEPVQEKATTDNAVYIRLGETDGQVVSVIRGRSGEVSRIKIKAAKLSASNIGAVVVNDGGQTVGIVESLEGGEASVLSPYAIRAAAARVLARKASVPKPWLGISGEPIADATLDRIVGKGWETRRAMALLQQQRGILLNSVIPHSPADQAALQAGDIIVQVNNDVVTNTDDFSLLLAEAGAKPIQLTVVRPKSEHPKFITVKLRQELNSTVWPKMFSGFNRVTQGNPLADQGIETVPVRPMSPLMRTRGLLVIGVDPTSAAAKAGLRVKDVIEAIDGKPVSALPSEKLELAKTGYTLDVVRDKGKLVLTVVEK